MMPEKYSESMGSPFESLNRILLKARITFSEPNKWVFEVSSDFKVLLHLFAILSRGCKW